MVGCIKRVCCLLALNPLSLFSLSLARALADSFSLYNEGVLFISTHVSLSLSLSPPQTPPPSLPLLLLLLLLLWCLRGIVT